MRKLTRRMAACALLAASAAEAGAKVPEMIPYQGHVTFAGAAYHGTGEFKFALVSSGGAFTYWSNDGTSMFGSEPLDSVPLPVKEGRVEVLLGNTALTGMPAAIPPAVFTRTIVYLRVWFSDTGVPGSFRQFRDLRLASSPYALMAAAVDDGAIGADQIADGAVTEKKLAAGAISASQLASGAVTTASLASGAVTSAKLADSIDLGSGGLGTIGSGDTGQLNLWTGGADSSLGVMLGGENGAVSATGSVTSEDGFYLRYDSGVAGIAPIERAELKVEHWGARLRIWDEEQNEAVRLGPTVPWGGILKLYQGDGEDLGVELRGSDGSSSRSGGGRMIAYRPDGHTGVDIDGSRDGAGRIEVMDNAVQTDGSGGKTVISLDGKSGTVTTQILKITGGADLSEQFDVATRDGCSIEPGMIVCIDPVRPGELRVSDRPEDPAVAGIISGAGGVNPGMLMSQSGTLADGQHPVALTGRVYCRVDADENGPIQPGDLLTTSSVPGHGMRADARRAAGAIIGKAMTGLDSGRGLVLVLVSLQ